MRKLISRHRSQATSWSVEHVAEDARKGRLVVKPGAGVVDIADDRLVEDIALGRLHPHRADQHQPVEIARGERRHLGRHPTAKAEPDEARVLDPEIGEQPLIERRDIARMAQPLRLLGGAEAGVGRHDHIEFVGQRIIEGQAVGSADIVMQDEDRTAATAAPETELDVAELDVPFAPPRHRRHHLL